MRAHAPVNRFENVSARNEPLPLVDASAALSFQKSETSNVEGLALTPVRSTTTPPLNIDFASAGQLSTMRISNTQGVRNFEGRRAASNLTNPVRNVRDFGATMAFSAADAQTGLGFDLGFIPRVSVTKDGEFEQRRVGGELRIGQNFDQRGKDVEATGWYLFAGADGEALVYEPDQDRKFTNRMALRDQVTVGDMQAGVSFTRGAGQLSLSYIRREVEYRERGVRGQETEDFAGVSFTVRK
ncbi:lipid A-modifier LpxR family protein [Henriciella sp. AS95]|uniref:lipid A-modifier LpxR family protein n=1 Tax=Henriciella sp. AS95 TaxID=3135782 RepID=UPI00316B7AD0